MESADFEELLRIQLAGDEDEPAPFLADEMRDHLGPLRPQGPQVGVDHEEGVVLAQLGVVVGQPRDRAVAGLAKARIGVLDPAGELDVLVAHERIAEELHLGRGRAGDQQDADLLADDLHGGRGHIVILRQLGAGVLDASAVLILADHPGREPERRPLESAVFSQHDALTAQAFPGPVVDPLFEHDRRLGVAQAACLDHDGQHHRVAHEDHRADLDLGEPDVARALVGPGGDREDRDILAGGGLDGAERIFAGVGAAVRRQDHAGDRLAAMSGQHAVQGVAQGRIGAIRLDVVELARPRRGAAAGLGRRLEVVNEQLPATRQRLQVRAQRPS